MKESLFEYHTLPLWSPYYYSGRPLYAQPDHYFLDLNFLYVLIFKNIYLAMNLSVISYLFLAGLGMYILVNLMTNNKTAALVAAIVYMFNGFVHSFVIPGLITNIESYSMIPFIMFFITKALRSKNWISYSALAGIFLTMQIYNGGAIFFAYTLLLISVYLAFNLLGVNLIKRVLKVLLVGSIFIIIFFGLSSIKLLPALDFISLSNRGAGVSYQEYLGQPIEFANFPFVYISNFFQNTGSGTAAIGFVALFIALFSLTQYKNRFVLYSLFIIIISFFISTESFLSKFLYNLPVFGQLRHIERSIVLFAFAGSILCGFGYSNLIGRIKLKVKNIKLLKIVPVIILVLIGVELILLQKFPESADVIEPLDIPIINYLNKDDDVFRTVNNALSTLIGASGYNYMSQVGISTVKGGGGMWFNDYVEFLSITQQTNPSKLWGLLNSKYVLSKDPINISNIILIKEFENCVGDCGIWEAWGPYLYENKDFMPRYYLINKSILVIGKKENVKQLGFGLLLNDKFNPKSVVIIHGREKLNQYNLDKLKRFNVIILTEDSVDQNSIFILNNYKKSGGVVIPDITEGKNSISEEDIKNALDNPNSYVKIEPSFYSPNKIEFQLENEKGYLVLSETFSSFPGWQASGKSKKEILKANGIITAVFVDSDDRITFKYKPQSFRNGLLISSITLFLLIIYFIYSFISSGGKNKG